MPRYYIILATAVANPFLLTLPAASKHPVFAGFGNAAPERGTSADADLAAPRPGPGNGELWPSADSRRLQAHGQASSFGVPTMQALLSSVVPANTFHTQCPS